MANKVTTVSYLKTKSGKDVSEHGEFQAFSGRGESLGTQSATKEIAGDMGECSIGDNGNENGDEAKDKAAELSRTVKPVQESTPQQVDEEPNKGDVSQSQSNSKTPVCSNQSTSQATENVDWQFYLDTLAPNIHTELHALATFLEIPGDQLESIRKEQTTEHEICFHLLWAWRKKSKKSNDRERLTELRNALVEANLKLVAEKKLETRSEYEYDVHNGKTMLDDKDTLKVAKGIVDVYARFGRYFKLEEEIITSVFLNKHIDQSNKAREIIAGCIKRGLLRTRQELCNGLNYVGNIVLIDAMIEVWSKNDHI